MFNLLSSLFVKSNTSKRRRKSASASIPCEILEERLPLTLSTVETHVNTTTANNQFEPDTASNASGRSVVVWTHRFSATDTDIKAQIFDANGNKVGSEITVANSGRNESDSAVSMDSFGDFVVVWEDTVSSLNHNIMAQRFNSSGAKRGSAITVASESKDEFDPSIASASNGDFVVSYTLNFSTGDLDVKAKRYSDSGALQSSISVGTTSADDERSSSVARTPDGRFAIAFVGNNGITLKLYGTTGNLVNTRTIVSGTSSADKPSVSMDNSGNTVVAWQQLVGSDTDIKARVVSSTGVMQGTSTIANSLDNEFAPDVAFRRTGGIYVVTYTRGAKDASSSTWQVRGSEITSATGATRSSFSVASGTSGSAVAFGSGNAYSLSYETRLSRSNDPGFGIFRRRGSV